MTFTDDELRKMITDTYEYSREYISLNITVRDLAQALLEERAVRHAVEESALRILVEPCQKLHPKPSWDEFVSKGGRTCPLCLTVSAKALAQAILDAPHGPGCQILGCGHKWPSCARCWTGGVCTCWKAAVTELARRVVGDGVE